MGYLNELLDVILPVVGLTGLFIFTILLKMRGLPVWRYYLELPRSSMDNMRYRSDMGNLPKHTIIDKVRNFQNTVQIHFF